MTFAAVPAAFATGKWLFGQAHAWSDPMLLKLTGLGIAGLAVGYHLRDPDEWSGRVILRATFYLYVGTASLRWIAQWA